MTREALMRHAAAGVTEEQYPGDDRRWPAHALPLKYRFAPGHPLDGLTLDRAAGAAEPGRRGAAVVARARDDPREGRRWYLKALPKAWRNRLTPLPEVVTAFLESIDGDATASGVALADALRAF